MDKSLFDIPEKYFTLLEALMKNDYQRAVSLLLIDFDEYLVLKKGQTARSIAFITQLASIQKAEDMEDLLNVYALPIGSASIKRKNAHNLSINGYVGFTNGWMFYHNENPRVKHMYNYGLSAPIGLSVSWVDKHKISFTLFASIIDIGSLVNQKLINDNTENDKLRIQHFLSPGLGFFYNLPKSPVTLAIQGSYTPHLKTIDYSTTTNSGEITGYENKSVFKVNASLLIDIPLFTLYNRPDKKKK